MSRLILKRLQHSLNLRVSTGIDKLLSVGFSEIEAKEIEASIDAELTKLTDEYATQERLKQLQINLNDKISSTSTFVTSTGPFQMNFFPLPSNSSITPIINPVNDPLVLEKEIKTTGQQLNDEIKQLQADHQLDTNLESKRRAEVDLEVELKLAASSEYAAERVKNLNEHLDRVSRQALTAIGGKSTKFKIKIN